MEAPVHTERPLDSHFAELVLEAREHQTERELHALHEAQVAFERVRLGALEEAHLVQQQVQHEEVRERGAQRIDRSAFRALQRPPAAGREREALDEHLERALVERRHLHERRTARDLCRVRRRQLQHAARVRSGVVVGPRGDHDAHVRRQRAQRRQPLEFARALRRLQFVHSVQHEQYALRESLLLQVTRQLVRQTAKLLRTCITSRS